MRRLRDYYGRRPLRLLAGIVSFALIAAGVVRWFEPGSDARGILLWFLGCAVGFVLVLIPVAWLLDRIAFGLERAGSGQRAPHAAAAYIRVPALLSGLLLLVFAPVIFRLGEGAYEADTAIIPSGYLARWLFATAALFGCSAVVYAVRLGRLRRATHRRLPITSEGETANEGSAAGRQRSS